MSKASPEQPVCGTRQIKAASLALPVLTPRQGHPPVRLSRSTRWRVACLVLLHVLMAAHLLQWWWSGRDDGVRSTVSPIEPSEIMYTLEGGQINAGFIFFSLAILATFLFGRFVCGWACHVVALQDASLWLLKRVGIHPKPFRSRFLVFGPLALALYMFVYPTLKRDVIVPAIKAGGWDVPRWLGEVAAFPGFSDHMVIEDYWKTFPAWYIAIPFLFVCGFATVYFLGAKGFCNSACPYGGIFAPVDKVSVGRIVVNDNCEQCGHCTAVCTSNVRVHQEVRDFGMVMDPGCMKCMDCVSVCPNEALSFKFALPAAFTGARTPEAKAGNIQRPAFDVGVVADATLMAIGVLLFLGYRGMFNAIPLLMAGGLAGVGVASAWKLWAMVREPNARLHTLQLKRAGRVHLGGVVFAILASLFVLGGAWGAFVNYHLWRADQLDHDVTASFDEVFAPGYVPKAEQAQAARRVLRHFELAGPFADGGFGWEHNGGRHVRIAWMHAVVGERDKTERHLWRSLDWSKPSEEWAAGLVRLALVRGESGAKLLETYTRIVDHRPELHGARLARASLMAQMGDREGALAEVRSVLGAHPAPSVQNEVGGIQLLLGLGRADEGLEAARGGVARRPKSGALRVVLGMTLAMRGNADEALTELRNAVELEPKNIGYRSQLAQVLRAMGRPEEASQVEATVLNLMKSEETRRK